MTLLNPAALAFAALVPVVVLLYLLKVRRRNANVSTLLFWRRLAAEDRRRALWQKLRRPLSLLLQLALLALLLFALARPELGAFLGGRGAATIVIIDARARMQTRESGSRTRFDLARDRATAFLRRAASPSPVGLLALTNGPRVLAAVSADDARSLEALAALECTDATAPAEDAVALAAELLEAWPGARRIVLLSDEPSLPAVDTRGATLEHVRIGEKHDNVGLTRLAARPLLSSPQSAELLVEIVNRGGSPAEGAVELSLDGRVFESWPLQLEAGERRGQTFPLPPASTQPTNARGWIVARWLAAGGQADALPLDDVAFALEPRPRPLRVLLVSAGSPFLERCLTADDSLRFELLAPALYEPGMAKTFDAVILDRPEQRGADILGQMPAGNFLFLRHSPLGPDSGELDHPIVTQIDVADPLLRRVDLRDVNFLRAVKLPFDVRQPVQRKGPWRLHTPLRSLGQALIVAGERESAPAQRFVAFAFGVTDSDLPLRVAFPLFITNTLHWLAGGDPEAAPARRAGEPLRLAAGERVWTEPMNRFGPVPEVSPSALRSGAFTPLRNGFYRVTDAKGAESWLAVNTSDAAISDLRGAEAGPTVRESVPMAALGSSWLSSWPPWVALALAALTVSLAEWMLYHRRRTE